MPSAFSVGYDDSVPGEKWDADKRCAAVRTALVAAGIAATIGDDPPWMDAGNLSGYYQNCSGGTMFVEVGADELARAKAIVAGLNVTPDPA